MPTWNLGTLSSEATKRTHRADIDASTASLWVNQAYLDFVTDFPEFLPESTQYYSVSSGDSFVTLPADFMYPISMSWDTSNQASALSLRMISKEEADAQGYYPVGTPQGYFIYANQIRLWPSANSSALTTHASSGRSYLLRYYAIPEDMVSATSVPSVSTENRIAILYRTEKYLHELVGNIEEAAAADLRYYNFVSAAKDAHVKRQMQRGRFAISLPDRARRRTGNYSDAHDRWTRT